MPVTELTPFPGNPRRGNTDAIRDSIRRHGQYRALVVRRHDGIHTILAGNHTAAALEAEGHATARCEILTCTDDEARRINLADNRLSDLAVDDPADLVELLTALDDDYAGTGWDADALTGLQALVTPPDLDDLGGGPGDEGEAGDAWPSIRIRAPHHLAAAWREHLSAYSDDEAAAFAQLLGLEVLP